MHDERLALIEREVKDWPGVTTAVELARQGER